MPPDQWVRRAVPEVKETLAAVEELGTLERLADQVGECNGAELIVPLV